MSADDILKILESIPEYIKYIYPGYLTMYIYFFLRGRTLKDSSYLLVKAAAISYIYITFLNSLCLLFIKDNVKMPEMNKLIIENLCLILLSVMTAYLSYRVTTSEKIEKMLRVLKINTTFYDNEIEVLADFNKGAWLCVYLKDDSVVYEGALGFKELEEGKRKYICLNQYYKYYLGEDGKPKEPYIEDHENDESQIVMIFYDSIKRIEKRA